jgi:diguanylate cyclase (GGDEF)-like protein
MAVGPEGTPLAQAGVSSAASTPTDRPGSLGRRLVLATLIFGLAFTVITAGFRTWQAWQANLASMSAELTLIDQVFQRTLSKAIWEMDREAIRTQIDGAAQVASIGRIELRVNGAGNKPETFESRPASADLSPMAPRLTRDLHYEPYPGASEVVGHLTLEASEDVLRHRLRADVVNIVVTQLVQTLLGAGLIMWLFNSSVTVHVRAIARHLKTLTPSNLVNPLRLNRPAHRSDELSLLEAGINDLQLKLASHLASQDEYERELAAHRDRLAELVAEQTTELRAANQRLEQLSRVDPLTGVANRRHFDELKDKEFRRAQRLGQPLCVLMCDVDYFKRYNDAYGHAQGDRCLQQIARALSDNFARANELVARVGGEEFAVLLSGTDAASARTGAERLQRRIAELALPHKDSPVATVITLSIGLAQFDPATMVDFEALLHQADQALYRAKELGRGQICD